MIFYDEKGMVIHISSGDTAVAIATGEKAPVWLIIAPEIPGDIVNFEIINRCELSSSGYREFKTFNVVYHEGPEGSRSTITGEVKNTGERSINNIYVYVSFYDTEGKIIDYTATGVEPETLGPGEIGTFEFTEPLASWQMPNYSLIVRKS